MITHHTMRAVLNVGTSTATVQIDFAHEPGWVGVEHVALLNPEDYDGRPPTHAALMDAAADFIESDIGYDKARQVVEDER